MHYFNITHNESMAYCLEDRSKHVEVKMKQEYIFCKKENYFLNANFEFLATKNIFLVFEKGKSKKKKKINF